MRCEERLSEIKGERDVKEPDRGSGAVTCDLSYNQGSCLGICRRSRRRVTR